MNNFIFQSRNQKVEIVDPKYFDYAASTPPFRESLEIYTEVSGRFYANPSSMHSFGKEARKEFLALKNKIAAMAGFFDGRLLFCSSGTEANNTIVEGHMQRFPEGKLLVAADVHDCIWYVTEKYPHRTIVLPVSDDGTIDPDAFSTAIDGTITMACINHVCNETGTIHPVRDIAGITSYRGVKLLIDGVQALGHIPVDLSRIPCDYYSFSAHKFGGPRSAGGVFIRDSHFDALLRGGKQEWELRAGTENIAGLAASVSALKKCQTNMEIEISRLMDLKNFILDYISDQMPKALVNGTGEAYPGIVSVSFPGLSSQVMVTAMSLEGFAISSGSACHASQVEPSRVILALGRSREGAKGTVRISMGYGTTSESVIMLMDALKKVIYFQ